MVQANSSVDVSSTSLTWRNYFEYITSQIFSNEVMHYVRPMYKFPQMGLIGFTKGFLALDMRNPSYCFYDYWVTEIAVLNMWIKWWANSLDSDIYAQLSGVSMMIWMNCAYSNSAIGSLGLLYFSPKIVEGLNNELAWVYIPILFFYYTWVFGLDIW